MSPTSLENSLSKEAFISILQSFPDHGKIWLAISGGMDSSVLLHLTNSVKPRIKQSIEAIYVDHGLNELSHNWGEFCLDKCKQYNLPCSIVKLQHSCPKGKSVEEWAREQRYSIFFDKLKQNNILFTAHHMDDQIETFFLQAFRGSGPRGLVSMPIVKEFNDGYHARPLLQFSRDQLREYAEKNKLEWQDDSSNLNIRYDRNYLRHDVLPIISKRWPAYRETISRLISHQSEYKKLLDEFAEIDLKNACLEDNMILNIDIVRNLGSERQKNLVFYWLSKLQLGTPNSKHMDKIINELINPDTDKSPCVNWKGVEVRRYKNRLYASEPITEHDTSVVLDWNPKESVKLMNETLNATSTVGKGISVEQTNESKFEIRYRHGGEKINPVNLPYSKTVKQLFQESAVLPWYRDHIPLIYIDDKLAVIPGFCVDKNFSASNDEPSLDIKWSGYNKVIHH